VEQGQFGDVDAGDQHPPARDDGHELVVGQSLQRFADGSSPDAEPLLQIVVANHRAGRQLEAHDHAPDGGVGLVAERADTL